MKDEVTVAAIWRLERLAPAIVAMVALLDLGMRLWAPIDMFCYHGWEAARYQHAAGKPFRAFCRYQNARTYGDLAHLANLTNSRIYRRQAFTTDPAGYRNLALAGERAPRMILMGDSQAAGAAVDDTQTLAVVLARSGGGVYNAAGIRPNRPVLDELVTRLKPRDATLTFEWVNQPQLPVIPADDTAEVFPGDPDIPEWAGPQSKWFFDSPLRIAAHWVLAPLHDDSMLQNDADRVVLPMALLNGDSMLVYSRDAEFMSFPQVPEIGYYRWLAREASRRGLHLRVLLLPSKYQVYAPLLAEKLAPVIDHLQGQERGLRSAGIDVINATDALLKAARNGLATKQYVFYQDDTHLTPLGYEVVAGLFAAGHSAMPAR